MPPSPLGSDQNRPRKLCEDECLGGSLHLDGEDNSKYIWPSYARLVLNCIFLYPIVLYVYKTVH